MASYKSNYIYSVINTISSLLFPLITFPYVARILMPDGIGTVNFLSSIISYIILFTSLGIPTYGIIEIAKIKNDIQAKTIKAIEILTLNLILVILGYLFVILIVLFVPQVNTNYTIFLILSINILLTAIGCEWFYQGTEEFKYIAIRSFIIKSINCILLFALVRKSSDLLWYSIYIVIGSSGNNILNFLQLRKKLDLKHYSFSKMNIAYHIKPTLKIFAVNAISSIYLQLDTIMLGFLSTAATVGYYTGAIRLTKMLMGIATSMGIVFLPRISHLLTKENQKETNALISKTIEFMVLLSFPLSIGLIILSAPLIRLFCGIEYLPAIISLRIMAPIILFISISYILAQFTLAKNKINYTIIIALICSIVNVLLNIILIPHYGNDGAAFGTLIAEFSSLLCYIYICVDKFNIRIFNIKHYFQYFLASIGLTLICYLCQLFITSDILSLIIIPCVGILTYSIILYILKNKIFIEYYSKIISKLKSNYL